MTEYRCIRQPLDYAEAWVDEDGGVFVCVATIERGSNGVVLSPDDAIQFGSDLVRFGLEAKAKGIQEAQP